MTEYKFQRESLKNLLNLDLKYGQKYVDEVQGTPFSHNMNWDLYRLIEKSNNLGVYTCRYNNDIVGFLVIIVNNDLHDKNKIVANNDLFYVDEEHRSKGIGKQLISFCEDDLTNLGVDYLYISITDKNPVDSLLLNLNFSLVERKYIKILKE